MNLRFWGGWFLAIACVCIFLTMGCESGSLGVKSAAVYGRVVNKDNPALGVANCIVRLVSKEAVSGGGELEQGYNFLSTITDANGYFAFEKVQPDNVLFEFSAPGYKKVIYPATEGEDDGEEGGTSETLDIDSVTIGNGASVDLKNIFMEKIAVTLPSQINVKLEFIDSSTKKRVDDNENFAVSFDGKMYTKRAKSWRETGVDIVGASEISVAVRNESEPVLYNPASFTVSGISDQYRSIELEPVTYDLAFQFLNVPQYLLDSTKNKPVLTFLVEDYSTIPPQNISIASVTNFAQQAVLNIPAIRNPQNVRIRMHGYQDEVISLTNDLMAGEKGSYRIDVDFQFADGHSGDDPVTCAELEARVGMLDNVIKSDIVVNMIGLSVNDKASIVTNFVPESIQWSQSYVTSNNETIGLANNLGQITAILKNSPTYFDMSYSIAVYPDNVASAPYLINSGNNTVRIGVPEANSEGTAISVDVSKAEKSSTSGGTGN